MIGHIIYRLFHVKTDNFKSALIPHTSDLIPRSSFLTPCKTKLSYQNLQTNKV